MKKYFIPYVAMIIYVTLFKNGVTFINKSNIENIMFLYLYIRCYNYVKI